MGDIKTVRVDLAERSYAIQIGTQILDKAYDAISASGPVGHAIVITDENVEQPHAHRVGECLAAGGCRVDLVVVPAGEPSKSIDVANDLWQRLCQLGTDRKSVVVVVGGGVVGDLAGFIAATYARGLRFFQVPTSLLAQVDSSVGGKVAINLPQAKNMVGCFWQPDGVLIDTEVLKTLPPREYRAGLAEVVKYGVILDADFFAYLEQHAQQIMDRDAVALRHIITRSCELKAEVVQQDEREETGVRAALNYGHTIGHAIEAVSGYGEILHGEAISIGMICESRIAERMGMIAAEVTERQRKLLTTFGLPTCPAEGLALPDLLDAMSRDKKVADGTLHFVLPSRLGEVVLRNDVKNDDVRQVLCG